MQTREGRKTLFVRRLIKLTKPEPRSNLWVDFSAVVVVVPNNVRAVCPSLWKTRLKDDKAELSMRTAVFWICPRGCWGCCCCRWPLTVEPGGLCGSTFFLFFYGYDVYGKNRSDLSCDEAVVALGESFGGLLHLLRIKSKQSVGVCDVGYNEIALLMGTRDDARIESDCRGCRIGVEFSYRSCRINC